MKDRCGINGWGLIFSDTVYSATLTKGTDAYITIPNTAPPGVIAQTVNRFYAIIACTPGVDVFYCNNSSTATPANIPAGANFNTTNLSTTSELVPNGYMAKYVKGGEVLHFIYNTTLPSNITVVNVTVALYAIQEAG
jgi:hypothetical protein